MDNNSRKKLRREKIETRIGLHGGDFQGDMVRCSVKTKIIEKDADLSTQCDLSTLYHQDIFSRGFRFRQESPERLHYLLSDKRR